MNDNKQNLPKVMGERLLNGLFKENPTFVLLLGMCPTLAVTTSAMNGLGMGLTTLVVLTLSNLIISALRKVIPDKIRIPAFIVIIASFVTIVELLLKAYIPSLYDALGIYIPLIVVNCIILGRAEAYAYSNGVVASLFDGLGMGMGFTLALTLIGAFRELLGTGKIFDLSIMPSSFVPASIFVMAPGAFFVLAALTAIQNFIKDVGTKKGKDMSKIQSGCGGDCMACDKDCKKETPENAENAKDEDLSYSESELKASEETKEDSSKESDAEKEADKPEKKKVKKDKKEKAKKKDKVFANIEKAEQQNLDKEALNEETSKAAEEKVEEPKEEVKEEPKEEPKEESKEEPKEEVKEEPKEEPKEEQEVIIITDENGEPISDEIEFFDIEVLKEQAMKRAQTKKKKRMSVDKAKLMLSKAEETIKEEEDND
jgi:electron transport complex protein RnfE